MSPKCKECELEDGMHLGTCTAPLVLAADQLAKAAETALRQWASYASDNEGDDLEDATHAEGSIYRSAKAALSNYRKVREGL